MALGSAAVSESVPRGNRPANIPANDLREWISEMFVRESDAAPIIRHLDAALRAERLAVVVEVRERWEALVGSGDSIYSEHALLILDEVGVAGLTGEES
jgi:hypothetical protein